MLNWDRINIVETATTTTVAKELCDKIFLFLIFLSCNDTDGNVAKQCYNQSQSQLKHSNVIKGTDINILI